MPENNPTPFPASVTAARLPPQNIQAEQALVGGLLLDNAAFDKVADRVVSDDFYRIEHRLIFEAITKLSEEGKPADVVTVSEAISRTGKLDKAGGVAYIGSLANNTPSAANITAYADLVHDAAVLRRLISISNEIVSSVYKPNGKNAGDILDHAEERIMEATDRDRRTSGPRRMSGLLSEAVDRIDVLSRTDSAYTGVPTGFHVLDEITSGLQPSDLVVVAGRPSMGKTALAMGFAEYAAINQSLPVAIFSMEMSGEQLVNRLLSSLGQIDSNRIRTGKLEPEDWPRLTSAISILKDAKIFIDSASALTPLEVRSRARRLKMEHGLGLVIIDYIQLMGSGVQEENRATEISNITRALKSLAKELNVPVVALS
ncbi:MAG: replicative DNA helicase, partial [Bdellovibrionota bacterium]